jgi:hypothetical protein
VGLKGERLRLKKPGKPANLGNFLKSRSGNDLGKVLLPYFLARLPNRSQDIIRTHEALVELHLEKPGLLVKLHSGDARYPLDLGAHGVGAVHSQKAAPLFHAIDLKGYHG